MRIGAFELHEPLPDLREPHVFTILSPWIDVGGVGSLALRLLEAHFNARELGRLRRPGFFYDFTRYRPTISFIEGRRKIDIPNTSIRYAKRDEGNDLLFLHCLEPHAMGETYVESTLKVLERLNVKRYCLLGGMYDSVPHTRPLIITGTASNSEVENELRKANVRRSSYQGPTTINIMLSEQAPKHGIETLTLIVHLPYYTRLEEDCGGEYALLSLICHLYNFPIDLSVPKRRGEEQYKELSLAIAGNHEIEEVIKEMEQSYDEGLEERKPPEAIPHLSSEIEKFLKEMEKRFGSD